MMLKLRSTEIEKLQELKNREMKTEPCLCHVDNVEMQVLDKTIKTFVEKDKNDVENNNTKVMRKSKCPKRAFLI